MFSKDKIHLVPPIVQDRGTGALDDKKSINERSNYVVQLEAIRDYCSDVIERFERLMRIRRK